MPSTTTALAISAAAILGLLSAPSGLHAQGTENHFSFKVSSFNAPSPATPTRLSVAIHRWATPADRDQLVSELNEKSVAALPDAASRFPDAGYLYWPGGLEYIVRYAQRTPRPDGGETVILVTDRPFNLWWDAQAATTTPYVVQLQIAKDGTGEGQLFPATGMMVNKDKRILEVSPSAVRTPLLTDVRREPLKQTAS